MNHKQKFDSFSLTIECPELTSLITLFGLKHLNPAQILSFHAMKENFKSQRLFQQYSTGSGKTTFSLVWMLYTWLNYRIPTIANYASLELCQYDYERLINEAGSLKLSILLITNEEQIGASDDYNIIFITTSLLQKLTQDPQKFDALTKRQLVLDEFDASLFDSSQVEKDAKLFLQFKYLVAFTGSPLEIVHKNIIENHMNGLLLLYPSPDGSRGRNTVQHQIEIFPKRDQQFTKIVDVCLKQCSQTPTLVILDQAAYTKFLQLATGRKLLIKNLAQAAPTDIKAFFATSFTLPQNGHFYTTLLSVNQGRGLDAPTNSAIEKAGGVYVVIGTTPTTFRELEQFKGRTARMGGHGQYSLILWGKTQATAQSFLQEHLTAQSSKELQYLTREYIDIIAPKLFDIHSQEQLSENDQRKDIVMSEKAVNKEKDESGDKSDNQEDEEQKEKSKSTQRNHEECKTCGKEYSKDHVCQRIAVRKLQEPAKNKKSKTLGKRKKDQSKTNSPIKQLSKKKRAIKQATKVKKNTLEPNKENNQPLVEKKAYVRINDAPKVVIPSNKLQQFKEQDLNSNNEDVLAKNQQQQQKKPSTKRQQALGNKQKSNLKSQREIVNEGYYAGYSDPSIHKEMLNGHVRVEQYTKAINDTCKDKIVLDSRRNVENHNNENKNDTFQVDKIMDDAKTNNIQAEDQLHDTSRILAKGTHEIFFKGSSVKQKIRIWEKENTAKFSSKKREQKFQKKNDKKKTVDEITQNITAQGFSEKSYARVDKLLKVEIPMSKLTEFNQQFNNFEGSQINQENANNSESLLYKSLPLCNDMMAATSKGKNRTKQRKNLASVNQ